MKKYLYIANLFIFSLFVLVACDDHKEDDLTPSKVYIVNDGLQEVTMYNTGELVEYKLNIYKSGALKSDADAKVIILSNEELQVYNAENGTDYKMLDQSCYTLEQNEVFFSSSQKDVNKAIKISFDPEKINSSAVDHVLPIKLVSSLPIEESKSVCLIYPIVKEPSVEFKNAGLITTDYVYGDINAIELDFIVKLNINKNTWNVTCESIVDEDYVNQYNSANGTAYKLLTADKYDFVSSVLIKEGDTETAYSLSIAGGELELGEYLLPIRLQSTSMFDINTEKNLQLIAIKVAMPLFDRKKWKIIAVSSEELTGEGTDNGASRYALDGDVNTFWHTQWQNGEPQPPHHITIDMGEVMQMKGFGYVSRDFGQGWPKACVIEVSKDNIDWEVAVSSDQLPGKAAVEVFLDFPEPMEARYFKMTITDVHDNKWATAVAEIYAY